MAPILPGSTIGVVGGGQLGRMLTLDAARMGYRTCVFDPDPSAPAARIADHSIAAPFEAPDAIAQFTSQCDVATVEFENIPAATLQVIGEAIPLHPGWEAVAICQNREKEKTWLEENGFPCPAFAVVASPEELEAGVAAIGTPCVLKTAAFGYDGKGQVKISAGDEGRWNEIWSSLGYERAVLEQWVGYDREISVLIARSASGETAAFDPAENIHTDHILDISIVPARVPQAVLDQATDLARGIADALGYIGLLGIELFVLPDGTLLVNEMAPRTHNSGHHTIDACVTSQFGQQVRAICGLPLGDTRLHSPTAMVNLLGDVWVDNGGSPDWNTLLATDPTAKLHLYGKAEPRRKRKMGHFTVLTDNAEIALVKARELKAAVGAGRTDQA